MSRRRLSPGLEAWQLLTGCACSFKERIVNFRKPYGDRVESPCAGKDSGPGPDRRAAQRVRVLRPGMFQERELQGGRVILFKLPTRCAQFAGADVFKCRSVYLVDARNEILAEGDTVPAWFEKMPKARA